MLRSGADATELPSSGSVEWRDAIVTGTLSVHEATDDGGCVVTEIWDDYRPEEIRNKPSAISGVTDRAEFNRQSMATTLERLAAAVEG